MVREEPHHRFGVKPSGNAFFDQKPVVSDGLRVSVLSKLSHEFLLAILELLDASDLRALGSCCQMLYAFANHPPLWKDLVLERFGGEFDFLSSWKTTYRNMTYHAKFGTRLTASPIRPLHFDGLYSDFLYKYWHHSYGEYPKQWIEVDNIDRRSGLSVEEFNREYAAGNVKKPVILTDVVPKWKAYGKWSNDYLTEKFGDVVFKANGIRINFRRYAQYCKQAREEVPLYLFDKHFCTNCPELAEDFEVPPHFAEDLFKVFGKYRPDYRWLIAGPAKSGSFFHKDPNATSAWNAVITGAKKWIMYPPHIIPPGVGQSPDGSQVSVPLSLHEWFTNFYASTKNDRIRPIECVCRAGEIMYVPSGWWHMVLNLEDSIAITQNFVSSQNLVQVRRFLRDKTPQVSGFHLLTKCAQHGFGKAGQPLSLDEVPEVFDRLLRQQFPGKQFAAAAQSPSSNSTNDSKRKASPHSEEPKAKTLFGSHAVSATEDKVDSKQFSFNFSI